MRWTNENNLFGNLQSYRQYTLPMARKHFGFHSFRLVKTTKHSQNVQELLELLAKNGSMSTWDMAKVGSLNDLGFIRTKEKEFRRLLVGRKDRGKKSPGVLDLGLVVPEKVRDDRVRYRLSLHGILYCSNVFDFTEGDFDTVALKYADILPWIFGKWQILKNTISTHVFVLKTLSKGITLNNPALIHFTDLPVQEINSYVLSKYSKYYESISESDLADQISYWFYTNLLLSLHLDDKETALDKWQEVFSGDQELRKWYFDFLEETRKHYDKKFNGMEHLVTFSTAKF